MSVVVTGSIAFDDIVTDHGCMKDAPGGSALYFSVAASLFAPVLLVGVVGDDFPEDVLAFLRSRGVNTESVKVVSGGKTFRWGGQYETDMNKRQTTNLELNVFADFIPVLADECRHTDYVFLGNINPELQLQVIDQMISPRFIGADTIECYIADKTDILKEVLQKVTMMMINDEEAMLLTGKRSIVTAAHAMLEFGPQFVVVKKGEHGSLLVSRDEMFIIPAYPVDRVIDPTGAGDTYAGGTFGYIAREDSIDFRTIRRALVYGGIVASFTVEDFSINRLKSLDIAEVETRMSRFREMVSF